MKGKELTWQIQYGKKDIKRVDTSELVAFSGVAEASREGEVKVAFTNVFSVPESKLDVGEAVGKQSVEEQDMEDLINGIKEFGVLVPLIVREKGDKYELLSGYRRKKAVEEINKTRAKKMKVPIIVVPDCDDNKATFILMTSNTHRSKISLKEQILSCGLAYRAKRKAEPEKDYMEAAEEVGKLFGVSRDNVIRYSLLVNLNDGLLELIAGEDKRRKRKRSEDKGGKAGKIKLSRRAGVSLAKLTRSQQKVVLKLLKKDDKLSITVKLASEIRKKFKDEPNLKEAGLYEFIKEGEGVLSEVQSSENKPEVEQINLRDLQLLSGKKKPETIVELLKKFLKEWREAGSPEKFKVTAVSQRVKHNKRKQSDPRKKSRKDEA